ncbi:MAG: type III toxin-antitoxin system ToxN/AbiQ family toxin [Erysipelotrichaceae bacterium]|nr:type III toxin-antitoxin system ToxN/AbiQ family toxin [Erysipelotrichaceae bacterium]
MDKVNIDYIEHIHNLDGNCIKSANLIGAIIRMGSYIYFIPVDSADSTDYDENGKVKKSTPAILRMFELKPNELLGKCLFSNMFPVPYKEISSLDLSLNEVDKRVLFEKKLEYIKKHLDRILKSATRIHKQKINNYKQQYLLATVDFKKLEHACTTWEIENYGKHINRFPDSDFFLTNPNVDGITEYFLMNKTKKVGLVLFDNKSQSVVGIKEIFLQQYAPLECFQEGKLTAEAITFWFKGRGIPSWRDGLDDLLDNLGIENKDVLLNKAFGLSLSDQYWLNPLDMLMDWNDINFFDNDFNSSDYIAASFEGKILDPREVDFFSPNNTSDGVLKKAWIVGENNERFLLKGSSSLNGLEPFNEVLAGLISNVLQLNHVNYTTEIINNKVLSKCECFIERDTELLSAYAILKFNNIELNEENYDVFETYIEILENHGLKDVGRELGKMFVLDYLIINRDRHLGNFGVVRNVETLEWVSLAPNFDSGQAMHSQKAIYETNFNQGAGSFFNKKNYDFESILDKIIRYCPIDSISFDQLEIVAETWKSLLYEYRHVTRMEEETIDSLYIGFKTRIEMLRKRSLI